MFQKGRPWTSYEQWKIPRIVVAWAQICFFVAFFFFLLGFWLFLISYFVPLKKYELPKSYIHRQRRARAKRDQRFMTSRGKEILHTLSILCVVSQKFVYIYTIHTLPHTVVNIANESYSIQKRANVLGASCFSIDSTIVIRRTCQSYWTESNAIWSVFNTINIF